MSRFAGLPCRMSSEQDRPSHPLAFPRSTTIRLLRAATAGTLSLALPFVLGVSSILPAAPATTSPAPAAVFAMTGLLGAVGDTSALPDGALSSSTGNEVSGILAFGDPNDPPAAPPSDEGQPQDAEPPRELPTEEEPQNDDQISEAEPQDDQLPEDESQDDTVVDAPQDTDPEGSVTANEPALQVPPGESPPAAASEAPPAAANEPAPVAAVETPPAASIQAAPAAEAGPAPAAEVQAAPEDTASRLTARGRQASAVARQLVGRAYRYGAAGPRAFDCSGLTLYVYRQFGVNLPHRASSQFSERYGRRIAKIGDLLPGDLVFFRNTAGRGITHAAIYVGDGMMVTANSRRQGVRLQPITNAYWRSHWAGGIRPYL